MLGTGNFSLFPGKKIWYPKTRPGTQTSSYSGLRSTRSPRLLTTWSNEVVLHWETWGRSWSKISKLKKKAPIETVQWENRQGFYDVSALSRVFKQQLF